MYQTQSDHNSFYYLKVRIRVMGYLCFIQLTSLNKFQSQSEWGKSILLITIFLSLLPSFTVIVPELNFQVLRLFLTNQFLRSGIFCFVLSSLIQMNSVYYTLWVYGYWCMDISYSLPFNSPGIPIK